MLGILLSAGVALTMLEGLPVAQTASAMDVASSKPIRISINGNPVGFSSGKPAMVGGRVLIPLRSVMNSLSDTALVWDPVQQSVSAALLDRKVKLNIGSRMAQVNGRSVAMDVPATTIDGRTMIPLRFLSEALGAVVSWNEFDRRVAVAMPKSQVPTVVASNASPVVIQTRRYSRTASLEGQNQAGQGVQLTLAGQSFPAGTTNEQKLVSLERQVQTAWNRWANDRASWSRDQENYTMWASLQLSFRSMLVLNGSSGYNGFAPSGVVPLDPGLWDAWQMKLHNDQVRDDLDQQRVAAAYDAYVTMFKKVHPDKAPLPPPSAP